MGTDTRLGVGGGGKCKDIWTEDRLFVLFAFLFGGVSRDIVVSERFAPTSTSKLTIRKQPLYKLVLHFSSFRCYLNCGAE